MPLKIQFWETEKKPILIPSTMSQVVAWCMYAVMQMIQNTSIIIAESTFYLCMEVSSFIFSHMQKIAHRFLAILH